MAFAFDLTETVTRPARDLNATLKRSKTAHSVWGAIVFTVFLGLIVLSLVTGEGSGPG